MNSAPLFLGGKMENIIGRRFGRLFVVDCAERRYGKDFWTCRCQCGKYKEIQGRHLKSGNTRSCGCLHKEVASQVNKERKQYNQYRFEGNIGIGICSDGTEFLFDKEDFDKIKDYHWYCNQGYIRATLEEKNFSIHRVIMGLSKDSDIFVDHTEGNPLDNRKEFLRLATPLQNCQNRKNSSTNSTGMAGVCFQKATGKYMVRIGVDKERLYLGLYSTYEEAVKARLEAKKKYYGDYARDLKYR